MTAPPPLQLLVGDRGHGVTGYAADLASALTGRDDRTPVDEVADATEAIGRARSAERTHVHVTDRLFGSSPEEAAQNLERLAAATPLTITVHDVPQASDGAMLSRRVAAYTRFFAAARAVAVNSRHEQRLVAEFLPEADRPHAIPLGARAAVAPAARGAVTPRRPRALRPLVVLLAGYVYPGKGHAQAIRAAAEAAETLHRAGEKVGDVVVRAIGGPSPGHERDVGTLHADAERRGIRFEVTGFLDDDEFARRIGDDGIPLAAHEHVSASRSMLDWVEAGRRPLVAASRYATEMNELRPGIMTLYAPDELSLHLAHAWRVPASTRLDPGRSLSPTLTDAAGEYLMWWHSMGSR
ncbi:MAG: hypothetical protein ACXWZG_00035 [Microbacterium sp.]